MFGSDNSTDCLLGPAFEVEVEVLPTSTSKAFVVKLCLGFMGQFEV